jgi:hypothetical protein
MSRLEITRYEYLNEIAYHVPSENSWILVNSEDASDYIIRQNITKDIFGSDLVTGTEGFVEGNTAFIIRLMIKSENMRKYCSDYLKDNTQLFNSEKTMPKKSTKPPKADIRKKTGVTDRMKLLIGCLEARTEKELIINIKELANYLHGDHGEVDPATVINWFEPDMDATT